MPLPSLLVSGALADVVALGSLAAMAVGVVDLVRHGRWPGRLLLVAGAIVWPVPEHPLQGPVIVKLSYFHGIHAADFLSVAALAIAVTWPVGRGLASSARESARRHEGQRPAR